MKTGVRWEDLRKEILVLDWLRSRLTYANVMATFAVFLGLATGGAYAANTIFSTDIVDGEVKTPDLAGGAVATAKLAGGAVTTDKVKNDNLTTNDIKNFSLGNGDFLSGSVDTRVVTDGSLTTTDIANFSLGNGDFLTESVDSRVVNDNSLTGSDINEATLVGGKDGDSCGSSGAAFFASVRLCAGSDGVDRNVYAAFNFCAGIGMRLPTWGEAVMLAVREDVPGVTQGTNFWSDEIVQRDGAVPGAFDLMKVDENGNSQLELDQAQLKTVCVTTPD